MQEGFGGASSDTLETVSLTEIEARIIGCLIEKERTTPEGYPLSTNALLLGCNQRSNRDPVTSFHLREVEDALRLLNEKKLVASVMGIGERVVKHKHLLATALDLAPRELSLLAVLLLRGPQTPGELRARTERYVTFGSVPEVEESLQKLARRQPPLARNNGRAPGQSQDRWSDTLTPDPDKQRPRVRAAPRERGPEGEASATADDLRDQLSRLQAQVDALYDHLGLDRPEEV